MRIDIHAHIVDRDYLDALTQDMGLSVTKTAEGQTLLRKGNATIAWSRPQFFDIDERLRIMDRQRIDIRILSLSSPSVYDWPVAKQIEMARRINDVTAAVCKAHPDRFRGVASLPLSDTEASLAELSRSIDGLGLSGIAIGSNIGGMPLNDARLEPIWAEIDRRRAPVIQHPMPPLGAEHMDEFELPLRVGFVYETTTAVTRMIYGGVFERYPNFPFILAHTGGAFLTILERLDNGYRLFPDCRKFITRLPSEYAKQLYYDSCSFYTPTLMQAHAIVGPERILWGSDDPYIGADTAHVERLPVSDADKALMLGANAARLFGIGAP